MRSEQRNKGPIAVGLTGTHLTGSLRGFNTGRCEESHRQSHPIEYRGDGYSESLHDGPGSDTCGESTKRRLAGCASMIRRSETSSLATANTPLIAFGVAVNATMPCATMRAMRRTYSERLPATRGRRSGWRKFIVRTAVEERSSAGDAASDILGRHVGVGSSPSGKYRQLPGQRDALGNERHHSRGGRREGRC